MFHVEERWCVEKDFECWPQFRGLYLEFTHEAVKMLKFLCRNRHWLNIVLAEIRPSLQQHRLPFTREDVFAAVERIQSRSPASIAHALQMVPCMETPGFLDVLDSGLLLAFAEGRSVSFVPNPVFNGDIKSPVGKANLAFLAALG